MAGCRCNSVYYYLNCFQIIEEKKLGEFKEIYFFLVFQLGPALWIWGLVRFRFRLWWLTLTFLEQHSVSIYDKSRIMYNNRPEHLLPLSSLLCKLNESGSEILKELGRVLHIASHGNHTTPHHTVGNMLTHDVNLTVENTTYLTVWKLSPCPRSWYVKFLLPHKALFFSWF